ncbi:MAG: c-type cytochrome [Burkholderiaceae bacterium]
MTYHHQPRQTRAPQADSRLASARVAVRARLAAGAALAALVATPAVQAADAAKADPAKGQAIAGSVCAACHGPDGNSPTSANPNLAGQHADYLAKQLHDFKPQGDKPAARPNAIMSGMAAPLSDADIANVSAYFASQGLRPAWAENADLSKAGEQLYRAGIPAKGVPACAGCHGPNGAGIPVQYPHLAGQYAQYAAAQLTAFRQGERGNSPIMTSIAARLSDNEIAALAEYLAGLR